MEKVKYKDDIINLKRKYISLIIVLILGLLSCSCGMSRSSDENMSDDQGNVPNDNAVNIQEKIIWHVVNIEYVGDVYYMANGIERRGNPDRSH